MEKPERRMIAALLVIVFLVFGDRVFKVAALQGNFEPPVSLAGDFIRLALSKNPGIAFSLPLQGGWLSWLVGALIAGLVYFFFRGRLWPGHFYRGLFFLFIIFGALSNLVDRLKLGFVVDYIEMKYFTVFNLADMMIVGGAAGLMVVMFRDKKTARERREVAGRGDLS